jgi:hypothetical protein
MHKRKEVIKPGDYISIVLFYLNHLATPQDRGKNSQGTYKIIYFDLDSHTSSNSEFE